MYPPLLRQLDARLLLAFHEIYTERNQTRAAARCGLTQSGMSQTLLRLRQIFDDPLFLRTHAGMMPTEKAELIAPTVREVLATLGGLVRGTTPFDPRDSERCLRVGTYQFATITLAPGLLALFEAQAPRASIRFTHAGPAEAPAMLAKGEIDIAVAPFAEVPVDLCKSLLATGDLVVASRRDWVARNGPLDTAAYFAARHVSIVNQGLLTDPLDDYFDNTRHRRKIAITVPHYVTALHLVAENDLLATLPRKPAEWLGNMRVLAITPPPLPLPPITLSLVWHQRSNFDPFLLWVISMIRDNSLRLLSSADATGTPRQSQSGPVRTSD